MADVIKILKAYIPAQERYAAEISKLKAIEEDMCFLRGISYDGAPGGGGDGGIDKIIISNEARIKKIAATVDRCILQMTTAEQLVDRLPSSLGERIIRLRWFQGIRFEDIPEKIKYSRSTMFREYNKKISELKKMILNETK